MLHTRQSTVMPRKDGGVGNTNARIGKNEVEIDQLRYLRCFPRLVDLGIGRQHFLTARTRQHCARLTRRKHLTGNGISELFFNCGRCRGEFGGGWDVGGNSGPLSKPVGRKREAAIQMSALMGEAPLVPTVHCTWQFLAIDGDGKLITCNYMLKCSPNAKQLDNLPD